MEANSGVNSDSDESTGGSDGVLSSGEKLLQYSRNGVTPKIVALLASGENVNSFINCKGESS